MTIPMLRTFRFDAGDGQLFARAAEPGEWAISGGAAPARDLCCHPRDTVFVAECDRFPEGVRERFRALRPRSEPLRARIREIADAEKDR